MGKKIGIAGERSEYLDTNISCIDCAWHSVGIVFTDIHICHAHKPTGDYDIIKDTARQRCKYYKDK